MPATLTTEASTLQSKSGSHLQDLGSVSCMQNHVPGKAEKRPVHYAMTNAFGFGGQNSSLVVGEYHE